MNKTILPVVVPPEPSTDTAEVCAGSPPRVAGEARESIRNEAKPARQLPIGSRGGQKLFVIRQASADDRSRYFFYAVRGSEIIERVTARSASLIWDYLQSTWPLGTRAYWIIL